MRILHYCLGRFFEAANVAATERAPETIFKIHLTEGTEKRSTRGEYKFEFLRVPRVRSFPPKNPAFRLHSQGKAAKVAATLAATLAAT